MKFAVDPLVDSILYRDANEPFEVVFTAGRDKYGMPVTLGAESHRQAMHIIHSAQNTNVTARIEHQGALITKFDQ